MSFVDTLRADIAALEARAARGEDGGSELAAAWQMLAQLGPGFAVLARQDAAAAARAAQRDAAAQERRTVQREQANQRARVVFPGTAAECEEPWPAIKAEWQRQHTLDALERVAVLRPDKEVQS